MYFSPFFGQRKPITLRMPGKPCGKFFAACLVMGRLQNFREKLFGMLFFTKYNYIITETSMLCI
jgi:hypothetical protein